MKFNFVELPIEKLKLSDNFKFYSKKKVLSLLKEQRENCYKDVYENICSDHQAFICLDSETPNLDSDIDISKILIELFIGSIIGIVVGFLTFNLF